MIWQILYNWQTLIAGLLGLAGGLIAYFGAMSAAKKQVAAAERQLDDARTARALSDTRQKNAVVWALRLEAARLTRAAGNWHTVLPRGQQPVRYSKEHLRISSSPTLRAEREDISLLDVETQDARGDLARALDNYNAHIDTRSETDLGPRIDPVTLDLLGVLINAAKSLESILD